MKSLTKLALIVAAVFALDTVCASSIRNETQKTESDSTYNAMLITNAENLLRKCVADKFLKYDDPLSGAETIGKGLAVACHKELENIVFIDCLNGQNKDAKTCEERAKKLTFTLDPTTIFMYITNDVLQLRAVLHQKPSSRKK